MSLDNHRALASELPIVHWRSLCTRVLDKKSNFCFVFYFYGFRCVLITHKPDMVGLCWAFYFLHTDLIMFKDKFRSMLNKKIGVNNMRHFILFFIFTQSLWAVTDLQEQLNVLRSEVFEIQCNPALSKKEAMDKSADVISKFDDLSKIFPNRSEPLMWKAQAMISTLALHDEWSKMQQAQKVDDLLTQAISKPARFDNGRAQMLRAMLHSNYSGYLTHPLNAGEIDLLFSKAHSLNKSKDIAFHYAFFMMKTEKPYNAVRLFREARDSYLSLDLNAYEGYYNDQCEKAFDSIRL